MRKLINYFKNLFKASKTPDYLGRDLSQHRIHTLKYEDLCK